MSIKCEFCGAEYEESPGKFCERCGRAMARAIVEVDSDGPGFKRCKKCGHRNAVDATICTNCGDLIYEKQFL